MAPRADLPVVPSAALSANQDGPRLILVLS